MFYDGFEKAKLWGQDATETFHEVFAENATYVVMFISAAYVNKPWTRHERRSALSRMVREEKEYVLPVRFDDTPLPGLPESTIYYRANDHSPAELAGEIARKLNITAFAGKASDVPPPRMTSPVGEVVFDYSNYNGRYVIGSGAAEFETKWSKASNRSIHVYNDPASINGVAVCRSASSIHQVTNAAALDFTSRTRKPATGQVVVLRNREGFYAAIHVLDIKDDTEGVIATNCALDMPFRPMARTALYAFRISWRVSQKGNLVISVPAAAGAQQFRSLRNQTCLTDPP